MTDYSQVIGMLDEITEFEEPNNEKFNKLIIAIEQFSNTNAGMGEQALAIEMLATVEDLRSYERRWPVDRTRKYIHEIAVTIKKRLVQFSD